VVANGVRDVVRFGKGRDGEERDANAQLVERGAFIGVRSGWVRGELGAEFSSVDDCCVGFAYEISP
jgi:hypothetical protein